MLCQAATHGRTQLHAVAERLSISFGNNNWVCSPVSETPWLEPTVEAMCLWQTFISGQCVRNAKIVANIPLVSPSLEPTTLAFPRSRSMIDDDCGPQVFKSVNFFSLPSLVSRSSTQISQLISQIVQKRPKSGLRRTLRSIHFQTRRLDRFHSNRTEPTEKIQTGVFIKWTYKEWKKL